VRKSLFDVLGKDVADRRVLDLFAGSGALGVEALSRGAVSALFVDEDAGAVRTILANLAELGLMEEQAKSGRRKADTKNVDRGSWIVDRPPLLSPRERGEDSSLPARGEGRGGGRITNRESRTTRPVTQDSGLWTQDRVEVWRADYRRAVRRIEGEGRTFDLVLLDPPYREGLLPEALRALAGAGGVAPSGLVVAEAEARLLAPEVDGLALIDERVYGGTKLMFWLSQR